MSSSYLHACPQTPAPRPPGESHNAALYSRDVQSNSVLAIPAVEFAIPEVGWSAHLKYLQQVVKFWERHLK